MLILQKCGVARVATDPAAALEDFEEALVLNPRSLAALHNIAHVHAKAGRNEEALKALDRVVRHHPDFVSARVSRGVIQARLGRRDLAHKDVEEARRKYPRPLSIIASASRCGSAPISP